MTCQIPEISRADNNSRVIRICESEVPLTLPDAAGPVALAIITGVEGPSYRPLGATMVIDAQGRSRGSLSSGCIEQDVILHAKQALSDGQIRDLRYGAGSPYRDLALPCGGGLDIRIIPAPDQVALKNARSQIGLRQEAQLTIDPLVLNILPQPRFLVLGKGPEARCFAALALAAGYPVELFSPDDETRRDFAHGGAMTGAEWPQGLQIDPRTAVTLFFHDHDWEPPLLQAALASPAFFVGAQGSMRAHRARCEALMLRGVSPQDIGRLASPFGVIPSVRDPRTLAASVLAQVLDQARLP